MGMLAGVTDCRRSWKWGCRGRLELGFNPRLGSHTSERTTRLWWRRGERGPPGFGGIGGENHVALAEWGPCGGDTANGAGSLNHGLLLLFLRHGTLTGQRERERLCICGYSKGL